jgi:transcriptional regulatory protein GAL4
MGPQSGNPLLKYLQSINMLLLPSPETETTWQKSPKPSIAENVLQSSFYSDRCIDWYFRYYNYAYPILHEGCFRAQCMGMIALFDLRLLRNLLLTKRTRSPPKAKGWILARFI